MAQAVTTATNQQAVHYNPLPLSERQKARYTEVPVTDTFYGIYHSHILVLLRGLLFPTAALFITAVLLGGVNVADNEQSSDWLAGLLRAGNFALLFIMILIFGWAVYIYADWRADRLIVTDQRVVVKTERPLLNKELRDIPMGKVQNIVVQQAGLEHIVERALNVARLIIDTSGMGQVEYKGLALGNANDARAKIMYLQGNARSAGRTTLEHYREAVVRSILYGTPRPPPPQVIEVKPVARSGYDQFNVLFPRRAWRDGLRVVWHRHWFYLIKDLLTPLVGLVVFEITSLIVTAVSNGLGSPDNAILGALAFIRPVLYILVLPFMLWQFADWRNDEYVLDKDRLSTVDTLPFHLNETRKDTELTRVTDATVRVEGIIANLLSFGDVIIKTPGEATQFKFGGVPNPFEVHKEIMHRLEAVRSRDQQQVDRDIPDWLLYYERERNKAFPLPPPPPPDDEFWRGFVL